MRYCQSCGAENPDDIKFCFSCGKEQLAEAAASKPGIIVQSQKPDMEMPPVETYLVKSILVTILCFMPFGVVALVHSAMAEAKRSSGDWRGAREASRTANKWANLAIIIGIALLVVFLIIGVIITLTIGETVANQGQILGR